MDGGEGVVCGEQRKEATEIENLLGFIKMIVFEILVKLVLCTSVSSVVFDFVRMDWLLVYFSRGGFVIDPSRLRRELFNDWGVDICVN